MYPDPDPKEDSNKSVKEDDGILVIGMALELFLVEAPIPMNKAPIIL